MKRTTKIATMVSGGAVAVGAFAAPALASGFGAGPAGQSAGQATGQGGGAQAHARDGTQLRVQDRDMTCVPVPASGALTASQRTELASMAQDEKLAHDLYAQFYEAYHLRAFDNIATAESSHLQALRTLLARYGITDPTAGQAAGHFSTAAAQATYDRLLAQGKTGERAALAVARDLEQGDITRYGTALNRLTAPDAHQVLQHLKEAESRHLSAVSYWITR